MPGYLESIDLGKAYNEISNRLNLGGSSLMSQLGPKSADLSGVKEAQKRAFDTQDKLAGERAAFPGTYNYGRELSLSGQQQRSLDQLYDAAAGRVPSPAELQLQKQSGINAAQQYGLAAALQGRSPGMALQTAQQGSLLTQAGTNQDAAVLRAQETAAARNALVQALQGVRGQEQNLLNLDTDWRKALLAGELGSLDAGARAAGAGADASAKSAAGQNAFTGSMLQTGATVLPFLASDKRLKEDVRPADLNKLAASLKGFRFKYKDGAEGEGERVGVMAQDAQRGGPIGKRMVSERGDGKLQLDVGNAVGAALAMSAAALRRAGGARDN